MENILDFGDDLQFQSRQPVNIKQLPDITPWNYIGRPQPQKLRLTTLFKRRASQISPVQMSVEPRIYTQKQTTLADRQQKLKIVNMNTRMQKLLLTKNILTQKADQAKFNKSITQRFHIEVTKKLVIPNCRYALKINTEQKETIKEGKSLEIPSIRPELRRLAKHQRNKKQDVDKINAIRSLIRNYKLSCQ